jgi:hypothetical protein
VLGTVWAQERWIGGLPIRKERRGRLKGQSTGGAAEQAFKHRARDALGLGGLAACPLKARKSEGGKYGLRQASMSRGVEARGSVWTLSVPRALGSFESGRPVAPKPARAKADGKLDDGVPRAAKNRGGGALAV